MSRAAAAILTARAGALELRHKADQSPVTTADHAAEAAILTGLAQVLPGVPVVSEEEASASAPARLADTFLLVDPLDGTRELVAGRDEFTVNLAIVSGGRPRYPSPDASSTWQGNYGAPSRRCRAWPHIDGPVGLPPSRRDRVVNDLLVRLRRRDGF